MPKVSVIIPNYNHGKYLKKRVDSVLSQTFQDIEVIVLDDASTDDSREILEQYRSNEKISEIIYNEENTGNPFYQWNEGIVRAKGKYIWIAESDDWCENNMLQYLLDGIERDEMCTISYCMHIRVDRNELNALHAALDHAVDRIAAAAADADDLDINYIIQALFKLKTHCCHPPFYDKESFRLSFTTLFVGRPVYFPGKLPHCFNFTSIYSILQHKIVNS